ncbi:complex I subunit 5 family protein [Telmatospirillum sp. J64-1]|uniref:complex I subunit 5 family protein n=1 Tax=Telmatospirillum sp. J64-1 TaxID=2502183 RepID=UPI00115F4003|nr:proton-conducting transporter membrane subunit [Telmatospirillum sp. J64-1]
MLDSLVLAVASVVLPLVAATLSFLLGRRSAPWLPLAFGFAILAAVLPLAGTNGTQSFALGGWAAPLGIEWRLDGQAALMMVVTAILAQAVALFAAGHLPREELRREAGRFWPPFLFLWAAMNAVYLSNDLFNLFVALELASLSAVVLVTLKGKGEALTAGMRYLLVSQAGSLSYLVGVGFLYAGFGTLHFGQLAERIEANDTALLALALMSVGLFAKTAFFPLHIWLPLAHGAAPAPASALLSGLVVKASFFVLMRLWIEIMGPVAGEGVRQLAGWCGAAAVIWGSLLALCQTRLKLVVAYSTVAQLGYLLLVLPLTFQPGEAARDALAGIMLLVVAHAFAKASMFLACGLILEALGHDRLNAIEGAARHIPMTVFAMGLAGLTLVGLPPSGGFVAKWLLMTASIQTGQWWWVPVLLLGGLLAGGYVFMILARTFRQPEEVTDFRPIPHGLEILTLSLGVASTLLAFWAQPFLRIADAGMMR